MKESVLSASEKIAFALRSLYKQHGYLPYHMSKFETYDLYAQNKEFLHGGGVITFNDTDGKLLALKPDVTLSIIKNGVDGEKQKVYYHENVYRISGDTNQFKELVQVGVECIGENDYYDIVETLYLAAASLNEIAENFVLDISHVGVLETVLENIGAGEAFNSEAARLLSQKSAHELGALCEKYAVENWAKATLSFMASAYGSCEDTLENFKIVIQQAPKSVQAQVQELQKLCAYLKDCPYFDKIRLDFSLVNDSKYYNGIVFKGFVCGVAESVLSGGQYDGLMQRMGRKSGAIGFAVYIDTLANFNRQTPAYDVDVLLINEREEDAQIALKTACELVAQGKSVRVQKTASGLRAQKTVRLGVEND